MTPAELHKLYLQLPASNTYSVPMTPRPQSGAQAAPPATSSGVSRYSTQLGRSRTRHHRPDVR